MCGRFTRSGPVQEVAKLFNLAEPPPELAPQYNVAPSQIIAVAGLKPDGQRRGLAQLSWGLVPEWANDPNSGHRPINARAETVAEKPTFRECFLHKRCLVPADGFYEWPKKGPKEPKLIRMKGGGLFAMAGLWDVWKGGEKPLGTCCLITTDANEILATFHDRMPVIIKPEDYSRWLAPETPVEELKAMLRPYPAEEMELVQVSRLVNSPKYDVPECVMPAA